MENRIALSDSPKSPHLSGASIKENLSSPNVDQLLRFTKAPL